MSKNAHGKFSFNPVSVNFLVEVAKTGFAIIMLMVYVSHLVPLDILHLRSWRCTSPPLYAHVHTKGGMHKCITPTLHTCVYLCLVLYG